MRIRLEELLGPGGWPEPALSGQSSETGNQGMSAKFSYRSFRHLKPSERQEIARLVRTSEGRSVVLRALNRFLRDYAKPGAADRSEMDMARIGLADVWPNGVDQIDEEFRNVFGPSNPGVLDALGIERRVQ